MVPFLHRCERHSEGAAKSLLTNYLVSLAQQDLTLPLIIFQHSKPVVSIPKLTHMLWLIYARANTFGCVINHKPLAIGMDRLLVFYRRSKLCTYVL